MACGERSHCPFFLLWAAFWGRVVCTGREVAPSFVCGASRRVAARASHPFLRAPFTLSLLHSAKSTQGFVPPPPLVVLGATKALSRPQSIRGRPPRAALASVPELQHRDAFWSDLSFRLLAPPRATASSPYADAPTLTSRVARAEAARCQRSVARGIAAAAVAVRPLVAERVEDRMALGGDTDEGDRAAIRLHCKLRVHRTDPRRRIAFALREGRARGTPHLSVLASAGAHAGWGRESAPARARGETDARRRVCGTREPQIGEAVAR